jgi:MFS family permease
MTSRLAQSATLRSLSIRNFRLLAFGMLVSQIGSWMTRVAQTLLVYSLTESGTAVGMLAAFQYLPFLVLSPWAGAVTDRADKRRLLFVLQGLACIQSLTLGAAVAAGAATTSVIFALAAVQGVVTSFDNPARRSLMAEMVPTNDLPNAISLNTAAFTFARAIGPALAGVVAAVAGYEWCFYLDALSYLAAIIGLAMIRVPELVVSPRLERRRGQIMDGLRYILGRPALRTPLTMVLVVGMLAWTFTVSLPLLVKQSFGASDAHYSALMTVMSLGSVAGALAVAKRSDVQPRHLVSSACGFGIGMALLALSPTLVWAYPSSIVVGFTSVSFSTAAGSAIQLASAPEFRGRVMAVYMMVFAGTTPIGSPLVGVIAEVAGARFGVLIGALSCFAAALYGWRSYRSGEWTVGEPATPTVSLT